ncbi:MAG: peptidylprolyl isomerase [Bulleidia sp.]|nr:peptidylprolyl isomerase [Bulleidia sp.]
MGKFIKKNWFVSLLVVVFAFVSVYYIYDTNKGKLKGKSSNGEDVVYEVDGTDTTASQFYDALYKKNGTSSLYHKIVKAVVDQSVETTDEMKSEAGDQATEIAASYAQQYSTGYKDQIASQLISLGYENGFDDLEEYLIDYNKQLKLAGDYAKDHFDELQIRNVSYILIKFENSSAASQAGAPTEDEQKRMDAVDAELAEGKDFATVAADLSEDSSTASSGGVLGTLDKNTTTLDEDFLAGALELNEGETSGWIYSANFGYFKIKCNAATPETLQAFADEQANKPAATASPEASASAEPTASAETETVTADPYKDLVQSYDNSLMPVSVWAKAQELGITFSDDSAKTALLNYMGLNEDGTVKSND